MKVKEIPESLYHTLRILLLSGKKLKKRSGKVIPVIVSLTSIPSRLKTLHITIRSILNQYVQPQKIILWLHHDLKNSIPNSLQQLEGDVFGIRYSEFTCSHRKLIHSLKDFPNDIIITCDDDFIYDKNWLSDIYQEHLNSPKNIIANQTRYISFDDNGNLLPYKNWKYNLDKDFNKKLVLPIGAGGVLYPPHSLCDKVTNSELFLKLAPRADDLWFKAMALLNDTMAIQSTKNTKQPIPIIGTQFESLKKYNVDEDKNRTQWKNLMEYFGLTFN